MKNASRSVAWGSIMPLATLLLISLLTAAPLWGPGLLNTRGGGDSPFLLLRTHQLAANLRAGVFPARWMPDAAYGLGYPFFSYYASLPYYVAAGFEIVGLDILTAVKLTQTLFAAAAAVTMYGWARRVLLSRAGAWLAAVAYLAAPFHLVNLYVRGDSLSEFAAFAFYPLILWGIDRLAAEVRVERAVVPALAYAGLIVTHNVSALIFSPFIILYIVFHAGRLVSGSRNRDAEGTLSDAPLLVLPVVLGLLLSAWFWVPALGETDYVQLNAQTSGYFFYGNHFRGTDLVQHTLIFNYTTGSDVSSPFAMGLGQATLALLAVLLVPLSWLLRRPAWKWFGRRPGVRGREEGDIDGVGIKASRSQSLVNLGFVLLGLLMATGLITPLSRPLWAGLPLLRMTQFPWRFLSVQAVFTALLTGGAVSLVGRPGRPLQWLSAFGLGALVIASSMRGLRPDYLPIGAEDVTVERLQLYELFTGNIGSTIRHEYLPRWVIPRPYIGPEQLAPHEPPRAMAVSGTLLSSQRLERHPTRRVWQVEIGAQSCQVAFPLYYWPGWQAFIDGTPVDGEPAAGSGYFSVQVPTGQHTVEIRLGRTWLRLGAEAMSLVAIVAVVAIGVQGRRARPDETDQREELPGGAAAKRQNRPASPPVQRRAMAVAPFVSLLALILFLQPRVVGDDDDLTMDFETKPYLHHNPHDVPLEGWHLLSYRYDVSGSPPAATVAPGESLGVILDWQPNEDLEARRSASEPVKLRMVSPAVVRHEPVPPVAEALFRVEEHEDALDRFNSTTVNLPVPTGTAPGIHLLQIMREEGPAREQEHAGDRSGIGKSPIYLRPIWVAEGDRGGEGGLGTFADGALRLHEVKVKRSALDRLDVQLNWSAARQVTANYGLSLSLTDGAGNEWLRRGGQPGYDTQPGHGFMPTSLWPLERPFNDPHAPSLHEGLPPADAYTLSVDLYEVTSWRSVGQVTATVPLTRGAQRPDAPVLARFGDELILSQLDIPETVRQGERLPLDAYWSTVNEPSENYVVQWRLSGSGGDITQTLPLAPGSSAEDWPTHAWVTGRVALTMPPTTPAGDYSLSLTVKSSSGSSLGSYTHTIPVRIEAQDRVWELPSMDQRVGARFGERIRLAGYDVAETRAIVRLTLYWEALTTPDRHYMFFVHLADPETGRPASQVDAMPHSFTYPTGRWAPGEVVTDVVELSTKDVPPGEYAIAVGWYDPATGDRLPAVDHEGTLLPDARVILQKTISVR